MLSIGMATSVPSGENPAGPPRPGQFDRPPGPARRGVEDAEPAEVADRDEAAVGGESTVAEAVVLVAVIVRQDVAGLDVPEPDLAHRHVLRPVLELRLLAAISCSARPT